MVKTILLSFSYLHILSAHHKNKKIMKTDRIFSPDGYLTKISFQKEVEIHGYNGKQQNDHISNDEFYAWIRELSKPERFEGYTITMTGFAYHDSKFMGDNEFVPARLKSSLCCR